MQAKDFCRYLANQVKFEFDTIMPCCWIDKKFRIDQIAEYQEYVRSNTDWEKDCKYCLDLEQRGLRSHRMLSHQWPRSLFNAAESQIDEVTAVEFQIDTECNAACIMCGPWASTTWSKYNLLNSNVVNIKDLKNQVDAQSRADTIRRLQHALDSIDLSKVKQVSFIGGEPFLNNGHVEILALLQNYVPLEQLNLRYISNGSQFCDQPVLDLWAKANRLHLVFSVDAIDKQFNYHRWPLQWHQVESNIEKYLHLDLPNFIVGLSITLTPLNIYYLDLVQQWATDLNQRISGRLQMHNFDIYFHSAVGSMSTAAIPLELRKMLIKKYGPSHKVIKILQPFDEQKYINFKQSLTMHDAKRKTDWRKVFPEIQHCFN